MILHTPTLFLVTVVVGAILAISIAFIAYRRQQGMYLWSIALALQVVSITLIGLRGQISDILSVVVGNMALASMFAIYGEGVYRFQHRSSPRWLLWLPVVTMTIGFGILLDDLQARLALGSVITALQSWLVFVPMMQKRRETAGRGQYILAAGVLLIGGLSTLRVLAFTMFGVHMGSFTDSNVTQGYTFLIGVVGSLCFALGFLTMNQERAEQAAQRATAELKESEAHLQAIFQNEPECIKIVDAQGRLVEMNPAGLELIQADSLAQVKGAPVLEIVAPEYREAYWNMHRRVIAGEARTMEFEVLGLKGRRGWLETHAVPMNVHGETVHLAVTRDITQRKHMQEQVRQLAFHDSLTDLPNRRLLLDRLNQAMVSSKRSGNYCALISLDLDNFKPLNDTHGHEAGDLLLIEVARRLRGSVREVDTVSRFGGDEFAVLLSELTADKAKSTKEVGIIAEKICIKLAEPYVMAIRHEGNTVTTVEHRCSASLGVVVFRNHESSQEEILRRADAAMYQAKEAGRNTVVFHQSRGVV
jgi:diguanylate cyclase (GGDEF)-like protein/PAS domain S-box-containing protein